MKIDEYTFKTISQAMILIERMKRDDRFGNGYSIEDESIYLIECIRKNIPFFSSSIPENLTNENLLKFFKFRVLSLNGDTFFRIVYNDNDILYLYKPVSYVWYSTFSFTYTKKSEGSIHFESNIEDFVDACIVPWREFLCDKAQQISKDTFIFLTISNHSNIKNMLRGYI